ncbi:MAG: SAM-dependent methyltransferase [Acidimicrobiia bacterium]
MTDLDHHVASLVSRRGPLPFAEVMDLALYHPILGFYARGGGAGRRGDFLTSPEVGPLFGAVVAAALDRWWHAAGEPDPYVVVEAGAGAGTLAVAVLAARPACRPALRYVLVERSVALRAGHGDHLALESPAFAFAPRPADDADEHGPEPPGRLDLPTGPIVVSLAGLPRLDAPCVVLANELLDNIAFDIAVRTSGGWSEVRVGAGADGRLEEFLVPLGEDAAVVLDRLAPEVADGARVPVQRGAARWAREALALARPGAGGRLVVIDYGAATTSELAARPGTGWLRTYARHRRTASPLVDLGAADITADIAVDQIAALAAPPTSVTPQAEWLARHGLDDLVAEGRRLWAERAGVGDLAAVRARSRISEAAALTDPAGLGAFLVLEWAPPER